MTLFEADMAVNAIKKEVDSNANIIFGSAFNENMKGKIRISVVATGIDDEEFRRETVVKNNENHEPSRFKITAGEEIKTRDLPPITTTKNFFDTGEAIKIDNEPVEEISDLSFKPKQTYSKEENQNYGQKDEPSFFPKEVEKKVVSIESFKIDSTKTKIFEENLEIKKPNLPEPTQKPLKPKPAKKESGGFSLFGFMNSAKSKAEKNQTEENQEDLEEEEFEEVQIKPTPKKPLPQKVQSQQNESLDVEQKRREFFSSTIFDEEDSQESEKIDDEILNVPAFFRRKK
jgi:hypothetical protein